MIFTGFKRKSTQFFFNKQLPKLLVESEKHTSNKVNNIIVFLDQVSEIEVVEKNLMKYLNVPSDKIYFVIFKNNISKKDSCDACFSPKDFGWYGKVKAERLKIVLTKKYDLLINYSKVENIYSNLLVLQSKAALKVGFSHADNRLYDLMIDCEELNVELFNSELKKYLEILKKI